MKQSEIDELKGLAKDCFAKNGWTLPPNPKWDVTDFGLRDTARYALVLVNLAEEPEYCEKLMYAQRGMITPNHHHRVKKEDIICRWGQLLVRIGGGPAESVSIQVNGRIETAQAGQQIVLNAGERITLWPGTWHEFEPSSDECIIGEVSTANDDENDNFFANPEVGRFPVLES